MYSVFVCTHVYKCVYVCVCTFVCACIERASESFLGVRSFECQLKHVSKSIREKKKLPNGIFHLELTQVGSWASKLGIAAYPKGGIVLPNREQAAC